MEQLTFYLEVLSQRVLQDGGFSGKHGGDYRPDATAWSILALSAAGVNSFLVESARKRLVDEQLKDGRISSHSEYPQAFWPTPLAIMAWQGAPEYRQPQLRAVRFLLRTTGVHWEKKQDNPEGHDPMIPGWPWVEHSHSWVEPTALSLLALQVTGFGEGKRAEEATRMLMDRVLPQGGWNYGNTFVFEQQLRPDLESTGVALNALSGRVASESVQRSLDYLKSQVERVRSPLALGWGILGLGAWNSRPLKAQEWILESLQRQQQWGEYDTAQLALLLVAFQVKGGITSIWDGRTKIKI